eukprot:3309783-Pleurochrysis_carterae.AAC.1
MAARRASTLCKAANDGSVRGVVLGVPDESGVRAVAGVPTPTAACSSASWVRNSRSSLPLPSSSPSDATSRASFNACMPCAARRRDTGACSATCTSKWRSAAS